MHMHHFFVYMLRCSDDSFCVGITNDVERRIEEHQNSIDPKSYTHNRRPVALVYRAEFREVMDAIAFETRLKGWGHEKKEALIRGDQYMLEKLSKRRGGKPKNAPVSH